MDTYFNTTNETGAVLTASVRQARRQVDQVLAFFTSRPNGMFAPHEVHADMPMEWPITSIRRAITTLTDEGRLRKTGVKKPGPLGKSVHLWMLAR